jgi:hypothetical protein
LIKYVVKGASLTNLSELDTEENGREMQEKENRDSNKKHKRVTSPRVLGHG